MADDEHVTFKAHFVLFAQLNDIYHIDTSADYLDPQALILPRIATFLKLLRKRCADSKGHFRFCVPGDFLAPSCLSKEFHGEHMVSVFNAMGVNLVSFGNHEFEPGVIEVHHLKRCIRDSDFTWLNLNIRFCDEELSAELDGKLSEAEEILLLPSHSVVLVGVMKAHLPESMGWLDSPKQKIQEIVELSNDYRNKVLQNEPGSDWHYSMVAMTHQDLCADMALACDVPSLSLIMGGHDHDVQQAQQLNKCMIVKAASNARTLRLNWVVVVPRDQPNGDLLPHRALEPAKFRIFINSIFDSMVVSAERDVLLHHAGVTSQSAHMAAEVITDIDNARIYAQEAGNDIVLTISVALNTESLAFMRLVPMDDAVADLIGRWNRRSKHSDEALCRLPVELIMRDCELRRDSTNFGNLMADIVRGHALLSGSSPPWQADVGLVNSGSVRIDRNIMANEVITPRTVCSILGHRNKIKLYEVTGKDLLGILAMALELRKESSEGDGHFLQLSGLQVSVSRRGRLEDVQLVSFMHLRSPVRLEKIYSVATIGYLGEESPYAVFFKQPALRTLAEEVSDHLEDVLRSTDPMCLARMLENNPLRWRFA